MSFGERAYFRRIMMKHTVMETSGRILRFTFSYLQGPVGRPRRAAKKDWRLSEVANLSSTKSPASPFSTFIIEHANRQRVSLKWSRMIREKTYGRIKDVSPNKAQHQSIWWRRSGHGSTRRKMDAKVEVDGMFFLYVSCDMLCLVWQPLATHR